MTNLTINDYSQQVILKHLLTTETLLREVASKVSDSEQEAKIYAMPDLGFPRNVSRIIGGFFTGALYSWSSKVPFIPIDATVNSCGVSIFKLSRPIEDEKAFLKAIKTAIDKSQKSAYDWNYNSGNHFINYGVVEGSNHIPTGHYISMHSSASEFKEYHNGLYPVVDNWFYNKIQVHEKGGRFLRYILGKTAEKFYKIALLLSSYNKIRQQYFADILLGDNIEEEVMYMPHYGMPNINSVAIGCNYIENELVYLLLTSPNHPCFFIKPFSEGENKISLDKTYVLTPHGLGMQMKDKFDFAYTSDGNISFNDKIFRKGDKLSFDIDLKIRDSFHQKSLFENDIQNFLINCPGEIVGKFKTIYSYNNSTKTI